MRPLIKPEQVALDEASFSNTYGKFIIEPLQRGFGTTLGNALRRVLLSSIPGAAIIAVRIDGVAHEFSTMPGIAEDVLQVIQNLKRVRARLHADEREVYLQAEGRREVRAGDFEVDSDVEIVNPDTLIATLTTDEARIGLTATLAQGRGYVLANENRRQEQPVGTIPMDAIFTPVHKVSYEVRPARIGRKTSFDALTLEVHTDGTIKPDAAVQHAAQLLTDYISFFVRVAAPGGVSEEETAVGAGPSILEDEIEAIGLTGTPLKALKAHGIDQVKDLVSHSRRELLAIPHFGDKSLARIEEVLAKRELSLAAEKSGDG